MKKRITLFTVLIVFMLQVGSFSVHAEVSLPNPSLPNPSLPNPSLPNPTLPNPSLSDSNLDNANLLDGAGNTGENETTNGSGQATEGKEDQGILNWVNDTYNKGKEKLNAWQGKIGDKITEWVPAVNQMVTDSLDWVKGNWEISATTALGIGLLIGGIFFPPLLVLGASVLIGEALSGLIGYYWSGLRGKELTQETAIGGILGLVSGGVLGVGTKLLGIGAKSILTLGGASGVITSVVDDLIRGNKVGLKKAAVWGTLSLALAGVPLFGQSIGKYINPAKPAVTASETQVGANVVKTSENSVASSLDKNELLRIMQTGEGNLYDLLKRAGVQPSFNSEDVLAAKNVIMQYKPKDIMTGKIPTEGIGNGVKFKSGYDTHLIEVEDVVRKGNKGIVGGHNLVNFEKAFTDRGWSLDENIISKTPHPTINGVYEVKYQLPALDREGSIIPGQYKNIPNPKTVYDPSVISNEQMLQWGKEAMTNGTVDGRIITGTASNGLKFQGYINNGEITNFFPTLR